MKKTKTVYLKYPLFGLELMVVIGGTTFDAACAYRRKIRALAVMFDKELMGSLSTNDGSSLGCLHVRDSIKTSKGMSTLCHEAVHAAHWLLKANKAKTEDEEMIALLAGQIVQDVLEKVAP